MLRRSPALVLVALGFQLACRAGAATAPAQVAVSPEQCESNKAELLALLDALPERGLALRGRDDLPVASLGGVIGSGRVLDIAGDTLLLDGEPLPGQDVGERIERLRQRLSETPPPRAPAAASLLYVAATRDLDAASLRTYLGAIPRHYDLQLVFRAPAPASSDAPEAARIADQLRSERDIPKRHAVARAAYARHARCPAVLSAIGGVPAGDPGERWPHLRQALLGSLPGCACDELDAPELREIVMAEQRAGAAVVGAVPLDFMRDERCGASFGKSPLQKIVSDIEAFDEEFAGGYGRESVDFAQVVTNDRLLNYLCQALPGETLAALQRERRTFYWKIEGLQHCQAWRFEPLAPGSPMGTWRRAGPDGMPPAAVHYWQGAEEIRLYGPVNDTESKPTDEREWTCSQNFEMRGIDASSIELARGRWFFDEASCEKSPPEQAVFPGCVAALAGGPPEVPETAPATFPALGDGSH